MSAAHPLQAFIPYGTQALWEGGVGLQILPGAFVLAMAQPSQTASASPPSPASLTCPLDRPYSEKNPFARILRGGLPSRDPPSSWQARRIPVFL